MDKEEAIQNYMEYIMTTPEFKTEVIKRVSHYLDTGQMPDFQNKYGNGGKA